MPRNTAALFRTLNAVASARDGLQHSVAGFNQEFWDLGGNHHSQQARTPLPPTAPGSSNGTHFAHLHHNSGLWGSVGHLALGTHALNHHFNQQQHEHRGHTPFHAHPSVPFPHALPYSPRKTGPHRSAFLVTTPPPPPPKKSSAPLSHAPHTVTPSAARVIVTDPHTVSTSVTDPGTATASVSVAEPHASTISVADSVQPPAAQVTAAAEADSVVVQTGKGQHSTHAQHTQQQQQPLTTNAQLNSPAHTAADVHSSEPAHVTKQTDHYQPRQQHTHSQQYSSHYNHNYQQHNTHHQQQTAANNNGSTFPRKKLRGSGVSVALNKSIMGTHSVGELLQLVRARGHSFDFFNISSAVSRAPKLVGACGVEAASSCASHNDGVAGVNSGQSLNSGGQPGAMKGNKEGGTNAAGSGTNASMNGTNGSGVTGGLSGGARALADHLLQLSMAHMHTFDARGLANTAWAFAKMKYVPDASLPTMLAAEAVTRLTAGDDFAAQNLSNLAWAMVYMHHRDPQLLSLMADRVVPLLNQFKPQELANILWAFASLEHHDHATLSALCARAMQMGPVAFKEQELSNILWALGRAHHYDGPLLEVLLRETHKKLGHFQPQGISNIVWALGQLNHNSPSLLTAIGRRLSQPGALRAFDSQGLSNLAYGCAVLHTAPPGLMSALTDEALQRTATTALNAHSTKTGDAVPPASSPLCLTTVLWAAVELGDHASADRLLQGLAQEITVHPPSSSTWEPLALAQAAWACAQLAGANQEFAHSAGTSDKESLTGSQQQQCLALLAQLESAVAVRVDRFSGQSLALAVSAFCELNGSSSTKLVDQLASRVERSASTLNKQQCQACVNALQGMHGSGNGGSTHAAALLALHKRTAAVQTAAGVCGGSGLQASNSSSSKYGVAAAACATSTAETAAHASPAPTIGSPAHWASAWPGLFEDMAANKSSSLFAVEGVAVNKTSSFSASLFAAGGRRKRQESGVWSFGGLGNGALDVEPSILQKEESAVGSNSSGSHSSSCGGKSKSGGGWEGLSDASDAARSLKAARVGDADVVAESAGSCKSTNNSRGWSSWFSSSLHNSNEQLFVNDVNGGSRVAGSLGEGGESGEISAWLPSLPSLGIGHPCSAPGGDHGENWALSA